MTQKLKALKAQDPTFNALVAEINQLNRRKEAFSQSLTRAMQTIMDAVKQITSDYAVADAMNTWLLTGNTTVIPAGQASVDVTIEVIDDNIAEAMESVVIALANGTGYVIDVPSRVIINIADEDAATVVGRHLFYNQSAWDGNNAAANAADDGAIARTRPPCCRARPRRSPTTRATTRASTA